MKKRRTFQKKIMLTGCPYPPALLKNDFLNKKFSAALADGQAKVCLTDSPEEARELKKEGTCVVFLLTPENRGISCEGIEWCVELPEDAFCPEENRMEAVRDATPEDFLWGVWLRSQNLPWYICETEHLCLRELMEEDLDFLYELQKDGLSARFLELPGADRETEREKLTAYRKQMYGFYGFGIWLIVEKESGQPVGRAGLTMREGCGEPELGYEIAPAYRQRGYAEEACRAVLSYAEHELELSQVRCVVEEENGISRHLCEKLGFIVDKKGKTGDRMCIFYRRRLGDVVY